MINIATPTGTQSVLTLTSPSGGDDTTALQGAIDTAIAGGCSRIYLPNNPGATLTTYQTSRPLFVHSNIHGLTIEGDSCGLVNNGAGTQIQAQNNWTGPLFAVGDDIPEPTFGVSGNFNYVKVANALPAALESGVYVNFSETDCGDLTGLTALTVECWVDPEVILGNASANTILGCGGNMLGVQDQCFALTLTSNGTTNTLNSQLRTNTTSLQINGTQAIPPGQMTHIVLCWDSATHTFAQFVNGVADGSLTLSGATVAMNPWDSMVIGMVPFGYVSVGPFQSFTHEFKLASIRVSNIARYTSAFTPSSTELACDSNTKIVLNFGVSNRGTSNGGRSGWIVGQSGCVTGGAAGHVARVGNSPVWYRWHGTIGAGYGVQKVTIKNIGMQSYTLCIQAWVTLHNRYENLYCWGQSGIANDLFSYESVFNRVHCYIGWNVGSHSCCFFNSSAFCVVDGLTTEGGTIQIASQYGGQFRHIYAFPNGLIGILLQTIPSNQQTAVFDECYFESDAGVGFSNLCVAYFEGMGYVSWRGGEIANTNDTGVPTLIVSGCDQIDMDCNFGAAVSTPGVISFINPFLLGPQACVRVKGEIFGDVSHLDSPFVPWMPATGSSGQGPLVLPQRHVFGVRILNFTSATTIGNSTNLSLYINDFLSPRLKITDTHPWLAGATTLLLPLIAGFHLEIANATAQNLTFQGSTNGTSGTLASVTIATGKRAIIRCEDATIGWVRVTPDT